MDKSASDPKQIAALVDKAAALVESKGKSAFPEFRKDGSEWRSDDTYLFVHDMKGIALFSVGFPKLEGTDTVLSQSLFLMNLESCRPLNLWSQFFNFARKTQLCDRTPEDREIKENRVKRA